MVRFQRVQCVYIYIDPSIRWSISPARIISVLRFLWRERSASSVRISRSYIKSTCLWHLIISPTQKWNSSSSCLLSSPQSPQAPRQNITSKLSERKNTIRPTLSELHLFNNSKLINDDVQQSSDGFKQDFRQTVLRLSVNNSVYTNQKIHILTIKIYIFFHVSKMHLLRFYN